MSDLGLERDYKKDLYEKERIDPEILLRYAFVDIKNATSGQSFKKFEEIKKKIKGEQMA